LTTYHPPPEERPSPSSSLNGDTSRLLDKLVLFGSTLAMIVAVIVMILGAVAAIIDDNGYSVGDYLNDLRALVVGLAAVLIALELPAAIHARAWRRRNDRGF
jgi:hypothetical protein